MSFYQIFFFFLGWSHQEPQNSSPILISSKPIFLRFIVFFTVHLLKVSHGETETELFWGSWWDHPVSEWARLKIVFTYENVRTTAAGVSFLS